MHVDSVFHLDLLPVSPADTFAMQAVDAVVRCCLATAATRSFRAASSVPTVPAGHLQGDAISSQAGVRAEHVAKSSDEGAARPMPDKALEDARSVTIQALMSATAAALGRRPRHVRAQAAVAPPPTPDNTSARTTPESSCDTGDDVAAPSLLGRALVSPPYDTDVETADIETQAATSPPYDTDVETADIKTQAATSALKTTEKPMRQDRKPRFEPEATKGKGRAAGAAAGGSSYRRQPLSARLWSAGEVRCLRLLLLRWDSGVPSSTATWESWSRDHLQGRTAHAIRSKAMKLIATEHCLADKRV